MNPSALGVDGRHQNHPRAATKNRTDHCTPQSRLQRKRSARPAYFSLVTLLLPIGGVQG